MFWLIGGLILLALIVVGVIQGNAQIKAESDAADARKRWLQQAKDFSAAVMYGGTGDNPGIAIDTARKKFAIIPRHGQPRVFEFEQLIAVEIERNGDSIQKTNRGSQVLGSAVGGILLGPLGILMGGVTGSKRTSETIKKLSLKLYTNNLVAPVVDVPFFNSPKGVSPEHSAAKTAATDLDQWYGRFRTIVANQGTSSASQTSQLAEHQSFNLILQSAGRSRMQAVIALTKLGIDMAEALKKADNPPAILLESVSYDEASNAMLQLSSADLVTSIEPVQ